MASKRIRTIPNIRHLDVIATVAREGGIRRASNVLHISQSAISQTIARLEDELGQPLFYRDVHGSRPTEAARLFTARIERALDYLRFGQRQLCDTDSEGRKTSAFQHLASTTQLRAFMEVVDQRSYTQAARYLGAAQPNVHRAVRDLERFCGRMLLRTSPLGIEPTAEAKRFARSIGLAFREIEQGLDTFYEFSGENEGSMVIGCLPLSRGWVLPTAVTELLKTYPFARLKLIDGVFGDLLEMLLRGKIDVILGALRYPSPAQNLVQETLFTVPLAVVVRAGHPILDGPAPDARALAEMEWIVPNERTPARRLFETFFASRDLPVPTQLIECSSMVLTRGLLVQSDRAALLTKTQLHYELLSGQLRVVPASLPGTERPIGVCFRADWMPTTLQAHFLSLLREIAARPELAES